MAKLTGKAKAEFLARMAKGRRAAARANPPGMSPTKMRYHYTGEILTAYRQGKRKKEARLEKEYERAKKAHAKSVAGIMGKLRSVKRRRNTAHSHYCPLCKDYRMCSTKGCRTDPSDGKICKKHSDAQRRAAGYADSRFSNPLSKAAKLYREGRRQEQKTFAMKRGKARARALKLAHAKMHKGGSAYMGEHKYTTSQSKSGAWRGARTTREVRSTMGLFNPVSGKAKRGKRLTVSGKSKRANPLSPRAKEYAMARYWQKEEQRAARSPWAGMSEGRHRESAAYHREKAGRLAEAYYSSTGKKPRRRRLNPANPYSAEAQKYREGRKRMKRAKYSGPNLGTATRMSREAAEKYYAKTGKAPRGRTPKWLIERSKGWRTRTFNPGKARIGSAVLSTIAGQAIAHVPLVGLMLNPSQKTKVRRVMGEYERGVLRTSSGAKVRSRKQAIAIALSEARRMNPRRGSRKTTHLARHLVKRETSIKRRVGQISTGLQQHLKSEGYRSLIRRAEAEKRRLALHSKRRSRKGRRSNPLSEHAKQYRIRRKSEKYYGSLVSKGLRTRDQAPVHWEAAARRTREGHERDYYAATGKSRPKGRKRTHGGSGYLGNPLSKEAKRFQLQRKAMQRIEKRHGVTGLSQKHFEAAHRAAAAYRRTSGKQRRRGSKVWGTGPGLVPLSNPRRGMRSIGSLTTPKGQRRSLLDKFIRTTHARQLRERRKYAASKQRRNPSTKDLYGSFQGRPSTKTTNVLTPTGTPRDICKLGRLRKLKYTGGSISFPAGNGKAPFLAADKRGKLHVAGGAYRVNSEPKVLGKLQTVEYETRKPHLGAPDSTRFYHHFGENGGPKPTVAVDSEGLLKIKGGSYRISSDGIIN